MNHLPKATGKTYSFLMSSNAIQILNLTDKVLTKESKRTYNEIYNQNYQLSIQLSLDGFTFNILDKERNKHLALVSYHLQEISSYSQLAIEIDDIFANNELLTKYYPKVIILVENPKSTLVPNPLFDSTSLPEYLKFNHFLQTDEEVVYDKLTHLNAFNVFAVSKVLKNKFRDKFARYRLAHYSTALIETLLITTKNQNVDNTLFVNVNSSTFDIVYISQQKLTFYNSFRYNTPEDFIYFLIFSMEQLMLNPETVTLLLMGEIAKDSKIYGIAFKYIRNIAFADRSDHFRYSYVLDEVQSHHFYTLLNVSRCEL